jgi:hypothetical protein
VDALRTATSYFDKGWNAFAQQKDGSIQWIPEQIVGIGEDFHSQVDDGKVKTTVYRVRWSGYDRTGDTWEPITHLQGYASMVKAFKESHEKDVERLAADRRREAESKMPPMPFSFVYINEMRPVRIVRIFHEELQVYLW